LPTVSAETNTLDDAIIVKGTKEKKRILDAYEECFGQDFDHSIVRNKMYPELTYCSFFQIRPELILLIWDIGLTKKWPTHKEVQTEATRQPHYIELTRIMGIPDPCGPHEGYQRIVVIYTKYLQSSTNYYNKNNLRSAMLHGYATAVNMLFKLRKYRPPIDFNDKNNMAGVIINNIIKEENIAKQCAPLDSTIIAKIQQLAQKSKTWTQTVAFLPT
jgi:hypothetical protein